MRSVALAVTVGLGLPLRPLLEQTPDWSRLGLGCSDDIRLAAVLSSRFRYVNTYLDEFPDLDLSTPPSSTLERFEFVVASDVLEHTLPPVSKAAEGLFAMLKPGGFAVVSVPVGSDDGPCEEYYPGLSRWSVDRSGFINWVDQEGSRHTDEHPEWHGGSGRTLAFRQFTSESLLQLLVDAGFDEVAMGPTCDRLGVPGIDSAGVVLAWKR